MTGNNAAEDASDLDDETLIEACLGLDGRTSPRTRPVKLPDWPPNRDQPVTLHIDPDIAAWFRARSSCWQRDVGRVLRGWIAAHEPKPQAAPASDAPQA
ncbi:MAG TPA: BrnA antitoxin family protein [Rhodopila sp.]|uniref:BrnA antitoxin family protein n=1 Tax=Rhodopila sp. TaxID=2480087 RepID=UPI002C2B2840|nr:BrnA antitoxin family protein [Rhodopila sp.]HVY16545.1 BrnA antitoxin family protein [Rhodopila sp.]